MDAKEIVELLDDPKGHGYYVKRRIVEEAAGQEVVGAFHMSISSLVRQVLCDILGEIKYGPGIEVLMESLENPDSGVRGAAADALAKLGDEQAGATLLRHFLIEESRSVYSMMAAALGAVHYLPATPVLIEALRNVDAGTRGASAWSLGVLGQAEARDPLREALVSETNGYARERMLEALSALEAM